MRVLVGSLTSTGEAVARLPEGGLVLVRGGCPGDVADIEIVDHSGPRPQARIQVLHEPSADRVEALCPHFAECSGCQWQHVSSRAQADAKSRFVTEALSEVPAVRTTVLPVCPSAEPYGYRNGMTFVVDEAPTGVRLGLPSADGHSIVPIHRCVLLPEPFQDVPRRLSGALRFLSGRHGSLGLRSVSIRISRKTGDIEVSLWTDPGPFPRRFAGKALADAVSATSVVRVLHKGSGATAKIVGSEVLAGSGLWSERIARHDLVVSAASPFPLNTPVADRLAEAIVERLAPGPDERALDTHAGVGVVAVHLADRASRLVALDASRFALADVRRNLAHVHSDIQVVGGDPARELPGLGTFDLVVVTSSGTGLSDETIAALTGTGARAVAYVSCDIASLSRDLARLAQAPLLITHVEPYDLAPQTSRVAIMVIFERDEG